MLSIANPSNGQGFFSLLYAYNWVKYKDIEGLTKDKVHSIATAKITPDRYSRIEVITFIAQILKKINIVVLKYYFNDCIVGRETYSTLYLHVA